MLRRISEIEGYAIRAQDENVGKVVDFLFDDETWALRWVVVDTGGWLSGRRVLLPISVLGTNDTLRHLYSVRLTMLQVKNSPDVDTDRPVSREIEESIFEHYGRPHDRRAAHHRRGDDDALLRSVASVVGYHIRAVDGEIGHVADFLVDDADWHIRSLLVDTRNWWPGNSVLIAPQAVREIDWPQRLVTLGLDRQQVQDSPGYVPAMTVTPAAEVQSGGDDDGEPLHERQ
jgi:hypothetical protein